MTDVASKFAIFVAIFALQGVASLAFAMYGISYNCNGQEFIINGLLALLFVIQW